jgi:hypothetical protein
MVKKTENNIVKDVEKLNPSDIAVGKCKMMKLP